MAQPDAPWRCRHGFHSWRFEHMYDVRMVDSPPHMAWICTLKERCSGCRLRRTRNFAEVPKRVKVAP